MNEMLIAIRSGVVEDWDGSLVELTAGQSRIAPDVLEDRPQFGEFFEADFGAPGTDADAPRCRTTLRDGTVIADDRF